MFKTIGRKGLSLLLAVLMLFSLVPAFNLTAGAESTDHYLHASPFRCWLSSGSLPDAELTSQQAKWDANPKGNKITDKITAANFVYSTYSDGDFWLNITAGGGVANQLVIELDLPNDATKFELLPGWGIYKNCTITASKDGGNTWYMVGRVLDEVSGMGTVFSSSQLSQAEIANAYAFLLADNPEKKIRLRYHVDNAPCANGKIRICNIGYNVYTNTTETYTAPKAYTGDTGSTSFDDVIAADYPSAVSHSYTSTVTPPTCTAQGYTTHYCNNCGFSKVDTYTDPTNHNFTSKTTTDVYLKSAATCTEAAVYYYKCTNCSEKGTETYVHGSELGHEMHTVGGISPSTGEGYDDYQQCTRCEVNDKKFYYTERLDVSPYTTGEDEGIALTDKAQQDAYWNGLVSDPNRVDKNIADYIVSSETTYTKSKYWQGTNWLDVYGQLTIDIDLPDNTSRFELKSGWGIYANCKILASKDGGNTWYIVGRIKEEANAGSTVYYSDQLSQAEIANTYAFLLTDNANKKLRLKFIPDYECNDGKISFTNLVYRSYLGDEVEYPAGYAAPVVYAEANYPTALKHNVVVDKAVEPTFTATGLTEGSHCSLCGEVFVAQQEIPMKKAVAINTTTNTNYEDFASAMNAATAGQTVKLLVDVTVTAADGTVVNAGVTLDLNGFNITTSDLVSFGNVIDTSVDSVGGIYFTDIATAFISFQPENTYMPIFDEAKGCYRLFSYNVCTLGSRFESANDALKFGFVIKFNSKAAYEIIAANPSSLKFVAEIQIAGNSSHNDLFKYNCNDDAIVKYANTVIANYNKFLNGSSIALTFTVYGVSILDDGASVSATPTLTSVDTGVTMKGNTKTYTK